jgi:hypothetical protein
MNPSRIWNFFQKQKKSFSLLFLSFLLFPLILIGINEEHDWGDDFSQYLDQSRDFIESDFNSIDVINSNVYVPVNRGEGFSLLLSLAYYFGSSISIHLTLISLFLIGLGYVLFNFFRSRFQYDISPYFAIILVLTFVYNYQVLRLKAEILTVFPFMFFLYGTFLIFDKNGIKFKILSFVLCGFCLSIAMIGSSLYLALILYSFYIYLKSNSFRNIYLILCSVFIPIVSYAIIQLFVLNEISLNTVFWYSPVFQEQNIFSLFQINLYYYFEALNMFFEQEIWWWGNLILKYSIPLFILIGVYFRWRRKIHLEDLFLLIYLGTLLVYPYQKSGLRFLVPIIPIFFIYIIDGIKEINSFFLNSKYSFSIALFVIILFSNMKNWSSFYQNSYKPDYGPQEKNAKKVISYIKQNIDSNDIIGFIKPWALHYYTKKPTYYFHSKDLKLSKSINQINYFLVCKDSNNIEVFDDVLAKEIDHNKSFKLIWKNTSFSLYRRM